MKRITRIMILSLLICTIFSVRGFAAKLDPRIPDGFVNLDLDTDGKATFTPPTYATTSTTGQVISQWKKFEGQLLIRVSSVTAGSTVYSYKTQGSIKSCNADEHEINFSFSKTGYYQFQVRGVNLEGNYTKWVCISLSPSYEGLPINEDDIGPGGGGSGGSGGSNWDYGPGIVQPGTVPAGYQYAVLGPNGEILYYYGGNTSNGIYSGYGNGNGMAYYQASGNQQILGPGYANNMQGGGQVLYPNTGVSNYQQVQAPNVNGNYIYSGAAGQNTNPTQNNSVNNPNYYNGTGVSSGTVAGNTMGITPQLTQGMEIGWHVDNYGRFYYQGNGTILKGTWYLINNQYFRFGDNGYLLANQWFKDTTTGQWYYLAGDGHMLTGWQNLNGTWYYFKPEAGMGYGTMYANTQLTITDATWGTGNYAFDSNGAMVKNAWYGGHYFGNDGNRTN